jgi:hypothetical protein
MSSLAINNFQKQRPHQTCHCQGTADDPPTLGHYSNTFQLRAFLALLWLGRGAEFPLQDP